MLKILRLRPHLWFQLYWVIYLVWFFTLDWTITNPTYIIHSPLDDLIPFCEWFIFPYCSWFLLLAAVTALLWWYDTSAYDKLCLMMFSGMTFCLIVYMILPNGVDLRPTAEQVGRDNIAMDIMQLDLEGGRLQQRLSLHPLPELGLYGSGLCQEQAGREPPLAQSSGLWLGRADLHFHRLYQAAFGHRCGLRSGPGGGVVSASLPAPQHPGRRGSFLMEGLFGVFVTLL